MFSLKQIVYTALILTILSNNLLANPNQLTLAQTEQTTELEQDEKPYGLKLKSKSKGILISTLGTAVPVAAGIILINKYHDQDEIIYSEFGYRYVEKGQTGETIGTLMLIYGLYFGPSMGHFYANRPLRGLSTVGIRALISFAAVGFAISTCFWDCTDSEEATAEMVILLGAGLFLTSMIYDFATIGKSVEQYNQKQKDNYFSLNPTYNSNKKEVGLKLAFNF